MLLSCSEDKSAKISCLQKSDSGISTAASAYKVTAHKLTFCFFSAGMIGDAGNVAILSALAFLGAGLSSA